MTPQVKSALFGSILLIFSACTRDINIMGEVDVRERTINVPPGGAGLAGAIKSELSRLGWRQIIYRGPQVTEQVAPGRIEIFDGASARYRLTVSSRTLDRCLDFSRLYQYDISLIDNVTGQEILTMNGRDCEATVVREFSRAITGSR